MAASNARSAAAFFWATGSPSADFTLLPLPYQEALADYLKMEEPETWAWFDSAEVKSEFAAACSVGDASTARRVLVGANPLGGSSHAESGTDPVATQLAAALRKKGLHVECDVGQSTFRLPLAVRRRASDAHTLGILIDDAAHFAQHDLLERYLLRPGVLEAFGWRVVQVFTKDWHHEPPAVLRQIDDALEGVGRADQGGAPAGA